MLDIQNIRDLKGRYFDGGNWKINSINEKVWDKDDDYKNFPYYCLVVKRGDTFSHINIFREPMLLVDGTVLGYGCIIYYKTYENIAFNGFIPPETIKDRNNLFEKFAKKLNEAANKGK